MEHVKIVAIPHAGRILLRSGNAGISVEHIDDGICAIGEGWNAYPCNYLAGGWIILFYFVIEFVLAGSVLGKDNVVAAGTRDVTVVGCRRKGGIDCAEQKGEVGLVGVRNLCMVDGDCALVTVPVRPALR